MNSNYPFEKTIMAPQLSSSSTSLSSLLPQSLSSLFLFKIKPVQLAIEIFLFFFVFCLFFPHNWTYSKLFSLQLNFFLFLFLFHNWTYSAWDWFFFLVYFSSVGWNWTFPTCGWNYTHTYSSLGLLLFLFSEPATHMVLFFNFVMQLSWSVTRKGDLAKHLVTSQKGQKFITSQKGQ